MCAQNGKILGLAREKSKNFRIRIFSSGWHHLRIEWPRVGPCQADHTRSELVPILQIWTSKQWRIMMGDGTRRKRSKNIKWGKIKIENNWRRPRRWKNYWTKNSRELWQWKQCSAIGNPWYVPKYRWAEKREQILKRVEELGEDKSERGQGLVRKAVTSTDTVTESAVKPMEKKGRGVA